MSDYAAPNLQLTVLSEPENIALVRHALAGLAEELGASAGSGRRHQDRGQRGCDQRHRPRLSGVGWPD